MFSGGSKEKLGKKNVKVALTYFMILFSFYTPWKYFHKDASDMK